MIIMTRCKILDIFILTVVFLCLASADKLGALIWKAEQGVDDYSSYASVSPVRFSLPGGLKEAKFSFRVTKYPEGDICTEKFVNIYLLFGSLPFINPMNESFPDKFFVLREHLAELKVKSNNVSVSHSQPFSQPGEWYAVAVIAERNTAIRQKGLNIQCQYKFSSSLDMEPISTCVPVLVNKGYVLNLTSGHGDELWACYRVLPTVHFLEAKAEIQNCSAPPCTLQLMSYSVESGQMMMSNCSSETSEDLAAVCSLNVFSPFVDMDKYLRMKLLNGTTGTVLLTIRTEDCSIRPEDKTSELEAVSSSSIKCFVEKSLDRLQGTKSFNTGFVHLFNSTVRPTVFTVTNASASFVPFHVVGGTDTGGTLHVTISFKRKDLTGNQPVRICGLLMQGHLMMPPTSGLDWCGNSSNSLQIASSESGQEEAISAKLYVPFPTAGLWFLALHLQCFDHLNGSTPVIEDCLNGTLAVSVFIEIKNCIDGECNGRGECRTSMKSSDFITFDSCFCTAGWKGFGCTDGSEAFTEESQLIEVLLLTLSNLFFIPAIGVAIYRKHYLEAIVYFYNMFFSSFYHACDGDRINKYMYCITHYDVLAKCDFLASLCSLWVTLIAMAQIPLDITGAAKVSGVLALVVGILLDRHSLWVIAVPAAVGVLIVILSWSLHCCNTRRCFPSKVQYVWMLPGILFAIGGAVLFAMFETERNYKYVHSAWHICLSLSIIFLLPPKPKKKVVTSVNFDDTESTEGLVLGPNSYSRRMNFEL